MNRFFEAQSVAVIGVSTSVTNLGRNIVENLLELDFQGKIYLVGSRGGAYRGHKIYQTLIDIPDELDLGVVLVPAGAVPAVLRQCGEKGIRRVVVESAGFSELGERGLALEQEVTSTLREYGMRMIGPNCIGIMNRSSGLSVPFLPFRDPGPLGQTAIVSQSGGVGATIVNALAAERLGFSKFASVGNKLDVNENDLVEYLLRDSDSQVLFCYLEGIADGRRLMVLAAESSKPIIIQKSNAGRHGALAALSHSASLAGDDRVVDAAFRQSGIIRAADIVEAVTLVKSSLLPPLAGNRLAVISRSGGHAVMAADAAEEFGFQLPPFPPQIIELVQMRSRAGVIRLHNPLDLGDLYDLPTYLAAAESALESDEFDGLLFVHQYQGVASVEESRKVVAGLRDITVKHGKPVALCVFTTKPEFDHLLDIMRFPIFCDVRQALWSLAKLRSVPACHSRRFPSPSERPPEVDAETALRELKLCRPGPVLPDRLASILSAYGIPLIPWKLAGNEEEAVEAARMLTFPVAVKTAAPSIAHRTEAGGVRLDIRDEEGVRSTWRELSRLHSSVLLQKQAEPGMEWLVGGRRDSQFGPVVVAGPGGIFVEILEETSIRICPLSCREAGRLLDDCRGSAVLAGVRGQRPLDRKSLESIIVRLSWLLTDLPRIRELDLNPVVVHHQGCFVLDWKAFTD